MQWWGGMAAATHSLDGTIKAACIEDLREGQRGGGLAACEVAGGDAVRLEHHRSLQVERTGEAQLLMPIKAANGSMACRALD